MTGTTYDATATGIPNLEGAVITKTGGNWTYSPQAYWKNGKAHTFFASAPGEATATLASGVFSYTVQDEVANQVDFMVADALKNDKWDEASTPRPRQAGFCFPSCTFADKVFRRAYGSGRGRCKRCESKIHKG